MNEHNPPMVASNGAVYSEKAVLQIAAQNQGRFKNPQTGLLSLQYISTESCQLHSHLTFTFNTLHATSQMFL